MTRTERERLVEQYLDGGMSSAEEQEFFIQVALDDELRRTLKAYGIVEKAIRLEREASVVSHAATRRAVAASLILSPEPTPTPESPRSTAWKVPALGGLIVVLCIGLWTASRTDVQNGPVTLPTAAETGAGPESENSFGGGERPVDTDLRTSPLESVSGDPEGGQGVRETTVRDLPREQVDSRESSHPETIESPSADGDPVSSRTSDGRSDGRPRDRQEAAEADPLPRTEAPPERADSSAGRIDEQSRPEVPVEIDWGGSDN